ncbi:lysophospholipid acyltransferase family protein [Salidesulfovibrio onnuriiensis]|uniref:lysophospholipid acyltransferase family protein n=1 Tax=Salidesulfovibrio onnuriiensis TaxID=2583823 RepID=UPI001650774E|nr:lysophospholipid acyltransferase family protein [Salidesulfovibrio onnuriiensis]
MTGRKWTSKSLASSFFHQIFYVAIRLGGRWAAYFMLLFVVGFYALHPGVRGRSAEYRRRIVGNRGFLANLWFCYRHYLEFGKMLADRAVLGILGKFRMATGAEDTELLRDLLAEEQKGLIIVTGHAGCWQLGTAGLKDIDAPKAVVLYRDTRDVDRQYYEHRNNGQAPFRIIDPTGPMGGAVEMMEALKQGSILCFMGDRNFGDGSSGVKVDFLGGKIEVPVGAYRLASIMGTPVVVTFSRRTGPGKGEIWVSGAIQVPHGLGRNAEAYRPYAQIFADSLEEYVRSYPLQFYNFYDMWENEG